MAVAEERLKVLQMLEDGKITAEEAAGLLRALDGARRAAPDAPPAGREGRFLRVQVTDLTTGASRVNVTVPMALVGVGLRIAERFAEDDGSGGFDRKGLEELLASGAVGKILEVTDESDHERVEIYVE